MTTVSRPVTRETACYDRGRAIVITVHPRHLEFRAKGTRRKFAISVDGCYWLAIKKWADEQRQLKRAARKAKAR